MTQQEELEMHALAVRLAKLTEEYDWEASRYWAIARTMQKLLEFVDVSRPEKASK